MRKQLLFTLAGLFAAFGLFAQATATIRGSVYNKNTGEAVLFGYVYIKNSALGVQTDVNGFYSLTKIPPGSYTLVAQESSYEIFEMPITVKGNEIITQNIFLTPKVLKEVVITAEQQEQKESPKVSTQTLDSKTINMVPSIGGVADVAQSVQVLPGVISTGDQGGQLYIRGGAPIQNKVLLDGMIIYNPFHSIGLFSVFDTDIIKNMDVYTGGFNADFGGRVSSVMDITTRDGNKLRHGGKVTISPFGAKLLLEGPILKLDTTGKRGSVSYVVSAKNSFLRQSSKLLYSYIDSAGLPFNFSDYYGKVSFNAVNGSKLNLFAFSFNDTVARFRGAADLRWKSLGFGSNFQVIPGNSATLIKGNFAYSKYDITMKEDAFAARNSAIDGFNLGFNFTYFQRKNVVNYGIEVLGFQTKFNFRNAVDRLIEQDQSTSEFAAYVKYKWISKNARLVLEPGFRIMYYATLGSTSPEPRFAFKYNVSERFRIKGATGIYSQNLISAVSDRDVVSLFYGFLSGSDNLPQELTLPNGEIKEITHNLQKANHFIFGFEWEPLKKAANGKLTVNVEGYLKDFTQLTNLNRNKIYEDEPQFVDEPDVLKKDFIVETGKAYGVDFLLKYEYKNIYLWTAYSYGFVKRWDGIMEYRPHFDRRHNINFLAAWRFGKDGNWELDTRWNFGSGFPFTPTQGFFENISIGNVTTDYTQSNGQLGTIYGSINSRPLPTYHRLDVTVKRTIKFEKLKNSVMEVAAGVTNGYSRENVFYIDRITFKRVNQLPIMPSISVNFTF